MIIQGYSANRLAQISSKNKLDSNNVSFTSSPLKEPDLFPVKNINIVKRYSPKIAFATSLISSIGYFLGGIGLFYDLYNDKKNGVKDKTADGVKTVSANTQVGKIGMTCTKIGLTAASVANIACGIGEGIPLMALGEASNLGAAPIIETPVGTGLFGIGIASIFAGLALDNTPEKKVNEFDLLAKDGLKNKLALIGTNIKDTAIEIGGSVIHIIKNIYKPSFWKEDLLKVIPTTVVFREAIDKDGNVNMMRELRHRKNYLMHAASFTLAVGGLGIILSSIFKANKPQKASLKVEEAGFLFDNLGVTKYGLDRFTMNYKSSGTSFVAGGILNAISQFLGLDNKDGRALQWIGIAGVFLGYTFDRGRFLQESMEKSKARTALTKVIREWKVDLSKVISDKQELKKVLHDIKKGNEVRNNTFLSLEQIFKNAVGESKFIPTEEILPNLNKSLKDNRFNEFKKPDLDFNFEDNKKILKTCTIKMFGSENPTPIEKAKKK